MKKLIAIFLMATSLTVTAGQTDDQVERVYMGAAMAYHQECNDMSERGQDMYMLMVANQVAGLGITQDQLYVNEEFNMGYQVGLSSTGSYAACMELFEFLWELDSTGTKLIFK